MSKNLRFTLLGLFAIMLTFGFTVKTQAQECDPQLLTYSVELEGIVYTAAVNQDAKTVDFTVPFGTAEYLDMGGALILVGDFTLSEGCWMTHSEDPVEHQVSGDSENNFDDPVAFTVHQEWEGTCTVEYFVTITEADNGCNNISYIELTSMFYGCYEEPYDVEPSFTEMEDDAWVVEVPYGTVLEDVFMVFGDLDDCEGEWTIEPETFTFEDGVPLDVTITAPNGISEKDYTLTVNVADASVEHLLLTFGVEYAGENNIGLFDGEAWGTVNEETHRVDLTVPYGTDVEALNVCFTVSDYACFYVNGPELTDATLIESCDNSIDFSDVSAPTRPRHFTVVAQDGESEDTYNVNVTVEDPDTDNSLTLVDFDGLDDCNGHGIDPVITQDGNDYTIRLRTDMDEETEFEIDYEFPALAASDSDDPWIGTLADGVPVVITITAEDGTPAEYTFTAEYVTASDMKKIVVFSFEDEGNPFNQTYLGTIDQDAKTILVLVPDGTETGSLIASFELEDEFAKMTHSEEDNDLQVPQTSGESAINYDTPAAFTVFAENCSTVEYFVTVEEMENVGNDITALTLDGMQYADCECDEGIEIMGDVTMEGTDIVVTVPFGTDLTTVEINATLDTVDATSVPAFPITGAVEDDEVVVVVTAADGIATQTYTLTVKVGEASSENMLLTFGFRDSVMVEEVMVPLNVGLENSPVVGVIDEERNRIDVEVAYGTPVEMLIPTFEKSPFSCVYLNGELWTANDVVCSDETEVDFSTYQTFTVVAQDGSEAYYNIYVEVLPADTQTWLADLTAHGLPECFGEEVYDIAGDYDGTDIVIEVLKDTDVSNLAVTFNVPEKATVMVDGDPVAATEEDGLFVITVMLDLSVDVEITVTPQDPLMDPVVYTVSSVEVDPSSEKMITEYAIGDSEGSIDQTNKVIEVWVPWEMRGDVDDLVATFTLSDGAKMTHSEDSWILQVSGETSNNFVTPVAYTVWAEDCTTLEYFVIVRVTPNINTGISSFVIDYTGCFCDDVLDPEDRAPKMRVDEFAKRIWIQIPYADENGQPISLGALSVLSIGVADGATVSPGAGTQDFSNGAVTYTVTAPDEVTKVAWEVFVENPPCDDTDIYDWTFQGDVQVDADIDTENHTISVTLLPDTDLTSLLANSSLGCGATICCSAGNCAGNEIDFSGDDNCHTCVVTAQDKSITQDWTICVSYADVTRPEVWTSSVLAMNCSDSVMVWGDKDGGHVFIVDEETANSVNELITSWTGTISDLDDMADWLAMNEDARDMLDDAVDAHMGASAAYPYADSTVAIMTDGIYSGVYYAFLVDAAGNVSCMSVEAIFIDECVVTVADLCALRDATPVYTYVVEGEVLVSYEEGDFKFVQDASCGIKVIDELGAWPSVYGVGQGLTNIKGHIDKSGTEYKFIPVCCYLPEKSSLGNTIPVVELSWDDFLANCYDHERGYESMLVRITDPMIAFDDYGLGYTTWENDGYDLATVNALGGYEWFIQKVFQADYIGDEIPTEPTVYQGIRTNVDWWDNLYGLITPRSDDDIIKVTSGILIADPDPVTISGVTPTTCSSTTVSIVNQGVGNLVISAMYLDDAVGTDEFNIVDPAQVPFTLGTWESMDVVIEFCPNDPGAESTTLLVEYGDGMVLEVPINGETVLIVEAPYFTDFNDADAIAGWSSTNMIYGSVGYNLIINESGRRGFYYGWSWVTPNSAAPVILESPGFDLSKVENTTLTWWTGTYYSSNLRVDISTDKINWTVLTDLGYFTMGNGAGGWFTADMSAYDGQTVFLRWYSTGANYYGVDNVSIDQKITKPIFDVSPNPGDFGGVQVNETADVTFTVTNVGVSVLNVKKVELMAGPEFTLTDANTYPAEVVNGMTYAFTKNGVSSVSFDVTFAPTDIGIYSGKVLVTYGLYEDKVVEIPFSGEGLSCYTATEAFVGENWAVSQNSWFTYTAEKFQIVNINSCHEFNTTDPYEYSFDTWLYVYADCEGTLIAQNDDLEWDACPHNRASSGVQFAMNEGETVKIFWPWEFSSTNDDIGFYFNIDPSYPIDGDVCETAIPLTLPVVNHFGSTTNFADDYDMSPCSPYSNYMDGNDKVYSITLDVEGYLTGNILGAYGSIHVLDECPVEELEKRNCKAFASGPNGGEFTKRIQPGFYYVIISTWAPPQTVDYLLNMSFEELSTGVDENGLMSSLVVYPNPTQGMFTVSISNAEAADLTLELVNISGQTVYRNEVKSVYSYNEEIDASAFAKGVYYLKVNNGEEVKVEKVVIQ